MFSEDSLLFTNSINYYAENFIYHLDEINIETKLYEEDEIFSRKIPIDTIDPPYLKEEHNYIKQDNYSKCTKIPYNFNSNYSNSININLIEKKNIRNENKENISKNLQEEKIKIIKKKETIEEKNNSPTLNFLLKLKQNEKNENEITESLIVQPSNTYNSISNCDSEKKQNNIFKTDKNKGKYHIFTKDEKKNIYQDLKLMSNIEVSKKYKVSLRNVTRWRKEGIERKKGSGRRFKDPSLEKKILNWYYENNNNGKVTTKIFRNKAKELSSDSSFKASTGWLVRIQKKYNLEFAKY